MFGGFSSKNGPVSFAFPSPRPPLTKKDWIHALMDIKRFYMERQYRQCAARCIDLLNKADRTIHPVHKSFLAYYAAASYEAMGRAAHPYSSNKISLLTSSLQYFVECDVSLPDPVNLPRLPMSRESEDGLSLPSSPILVNPGKALATFQSPHPARAVRNSIMAGINRMIDASLLDLDDPFIDIDDSDDEAAPPLPLLQKLQIVKDSPIHASSRIPKPTNSPKKQGLVSPRPLRINKESDEAASEITVIPAKATPVGRINAAIEWTSSPLSAETSPGSVVTVLPLASDKASPDTPCTSPPAPVPITPQNKYIPDIALEDLTPVRAAQIVRSNRGITFLREQIATSIVALQAHISQVQQLQAVRRNRKMQRAASLWSIDATGNGNAQDSEQVPDSDPLIDESGNIFYKETKEQRIARLRAERWETVGLRSPRSTWKGSRYYQDFCAMVMNELDLNS